MTALGLRVARRVTLEIGVGQIVEGDRPVESEQPADARKQRRFKRLAMAHQHIGGPIQLHQTHRLEVDIEQLAQPTALTQPTLGRQFRARRGHAPQDHPQHRRALRPCQPQRLQHLDELHLRHRPQPHCLDADRARAAEL